MWVKNHKTQKNITVETYFIAIGVQKKTFLNVLTVLTDMQALGDQFQTENRLDE